MNKTLLVIGTILAGIGLFTGGLFFGQANAQTIRPGSMMANWNGPVGPGMVGDRDGQYTSGMMGGNMMGNWNGQIGPGMMDNGMMGMMMNGGMMSSFGYTPDVEIDVAADEAINIAQEYLDANLPGKTADETADAFPGYYTIHVVEDGETIGMLSVNAYTGQVFLHHWHGDFIEMIGEGHE